MGCLFCSQSRECPTGQSLGPSTPRAWAPAALHAQGVAGDLSPPTEVGWHKGTVQPGHAPGDRSRRIGAVLSWDPWGHCAPVGAGPHLLASVTRFPPAPHPDQSLLLSQEWCRRGLPGGGEVAGLCLCLFRGDYALQTALWELLLLLLLLLLSGELVKLASRQSSAPSRCCLLESSHSTVSSVFLARPDVRNLPQRH